MAKQNWKQIATFRSKSSPNTFYTVKVCVETGVLGCNCRGYKYARSCWHTKDAAENYGFLIPKSLRDIRIERKKYEQEQKEISEFEDIITIEAEYKPVLNENTKEHDLIKVTQNA